MADKLLGWDLLSSLLHSSWFRGMIMPICQRQASFMSDSLVPRQRNTLSPSLCVPLMVDS